MEKVWNIAEPDEKLVRRLYRRLGCHPVTAAVLVNRGIESEQAASGYLSPSLRDIETLFCLKDLEKASRRIAEGIENQEKILIFGDYDVDGITATAIVYQFLEHAGADVSYHIPHRIEEGYGLKPEHISDTAQADNAGLIITVDCGSASHAAVEQAGRAGIDVIITDHHDIDKLPPACAVVNPKRDDCTSGLRHLAGVGVAFALLMQLRKDLREKGFFENGKEPNLKDACDLVALGTVADVVPLIDENRVITRTGIEIMNNALRPGLQALVRACGIQKPMLEAEDLAFRLAPRLNAAGRMEHAGLAVRLLTTDDYDEAGSLAGHVNSLNSQRQNVEARILRRIEMYLEQSPEILKKKALVLADEQWHQGVLGIVASRLAEKYCRPVVLFCANSGAWSGSARSLPGIDLYESISACSVHLESFGGHAMAAGLRAGTSQIDSFRNAFESCISKSYVDSLFVPCLEIDCILSFDMISENLADELAGLEPFGEKNPEPVFAAQDVEVVFSKIMGERHMRLMLRQPGSKKNRSFPAVRFNIDPQQPVPRSLGRVAFRLRWNYYNGKRDIQLVVEEIEEKSET
ncbi:MAG: single-stranded-DNA-specific exonuclease RecJ [Desulfobacteraceae bacterium]|nr:single-stranded-DNA-specific exonuclease RecJ [Desulfobacteraceae bacterium]